MRSFGRTITSAVLLVILGGVGAPAVPARQALADEEPAAMRTPAQLKELVGPVALYPDAVLASLLPATTFPLDVVAAVRWLDTEGGTADAVPEDRGWDGSVQALVQFPDVLHWLNDNLDWMEQMGAAVAVQQAEVLQAIQDFRRESKDAGHLVSGPEQTVREEPAPEAPAGTTVIVIQPTDPQVVYVPVYDPVVVTRPYYGTPRPLLSFSLGFAIGALGAWAWHEIGWGWWDWRYQRGWHGGIYHHSSVYYGGYGYSRPPGWWAGPDRPAAWRPPPSYRPRPVPYRDRPVARPTAPRPVYPTARPGGTRPVVRPPETRPDARPRPWTPSPVAPTRPPSLPTTKPAKAKDPKAPPTFQPPGSYAPQTPYKPQKAGDPKPYPKPPQGPMTRPTTVPSKGRDPYGDRGKGSLRPAPQTPYAPPPAAVPKRKPPPPVSPTTSRPPPSNVPKTRPAPSAQPPTKYTRVPSSQTREWSARGKQSKSPKPTPTPTPPPPPRKKR